MADSPPRPPWLYRFVRDRTGQSTTIGVVLLLFALGQAVGLPFLELAAGALSTQTGQWLAVAFFAVLLIGAAQKVTPTG